MAPCRWDPLSGATAVRARVSRRTPVRGVAKRLLHAFIRWQLRRLDRFIAAQAPHHRCPL
jgi:hypothetical protein